jgi:hypothetical protein
MTKKFDRAIVVALEAHKMAPEALNDSMRDFARTMVLELLRDMTFVEPCDMWSDGFNAATAEIRSRVET